MGVSIYSAPLPPGLPAAVVLRCAISAGIRVPATADARAVSGGDLDNKTRGSEFTHHTRRPRRKTRAAKS